MAERYEYLTLPLRAATNQYEAEERRNHLNHLGSQGWELVGIVPSQQEGHTHGSEHEGFFGGEHTTQHTTTSTTMYEAFFKRRVAY